MAGGPSCLPERKVADLVIIRKQWAQRPGRIWLWLMPRGCDCIHCMRWPENTPGWAEGGGSWFLRTGQPCSSEHPARRSSLVSRNREGHFNTLPWHLTVKIKSSLGENQDRFNETRVKHLERIRPSRTRPSTLETAGQEECIGIQRARCHPRGLRNTFPFR